MAQIFISYATEDITFVGPVVQELQARFSGVVYYDRGQRPRQTSTITRMLRDEINRSVALICFVSDSSAKSDYVRLELDYARGNKSKIPVLHVLVPEVGAGKNRRIPEGLSLQINSAYIPLVEADTKTHADVAREIRDRLSTLAWRPEIHVDSLLDAHIEHRRRHLERQSLPRKNGDERGDTQGWAVLEPKRHNDNPRCLFSEITGFFILDSLFLYDLTADVSFYREASEAACWLIEVAKSDKCHGIRTRFYFNHDEDDKLVNTSFSGGQIYAFDTAICLIALVSLTRQWGHLEGDNREAGRRYQFLDEACQIGDFLCDTMMYPDDDRSPEPLASVYLSLEDRRLEAQDDARWSRRFGPHHARVAEALAELSNLVTGAKRERYRHHARRICDAILSMQDPEGDMQTSTGWTELHPLAYGAEGLLRVGEILEEARYIESATLIVEWALDQQHVEGYLPQRFRFFEKESGAGNEKYRTDAVAQILLVADRLRLAETDPEYRLKIDRLVKFLNGRCDRKKTALFPFGHLERDDEKEPIECETISYWPIMYAVHSLTRYKLSRLAQEARVIVLAGGSGTRHWPLSCDRVPKPFATAMLRDRSLLQETLERYTKARLIPPENIYVLCGREVRRNTLGLCQSYGIPSDRVIADRSGSPEGTIAAVRDCIRQISQPDDAPSDHRFDGRAIIVSMADDVFEPWHAPWGVIERMLLAVDTDAARKNQALIVLGKPTDEHDSRFGYMEYDAGSESTFGCRSVTRFLAKPENPPWDESASGETNPEWVWDCGTLMALGGTWNSLLQGETTGSLDLDIMAREQCFRQLYVAPLHSTVRFDDFGVPGKNLLSFFRGTEHEKHANVVLSSSGNSGLQPRVRVLCGTGNVIISDRRNVDVYGLNDHLVIDSAITNSSLITPLDQHSHFLKKKYDVLRADEELTPYFIGGRRARWAAPVKRVYSGKARVHVDPISGLTVVNGNSDLEIVRDEDRLKIHCDAAMSPAISDGDFATLFLRQEQDFRLVRHLVHVYAIGRELGEHIPSEWQEWILWPLLLFHDFGGCLNQAREAEERKTWDDIKKVTKLDRRHLDTYLIDQLLGGDDAEIDKEGRMKRLQLFNDDVNSAVAFVQNRASEYKQSGKNHLLDIVVILLQTHDSPRRFHSFASSYGEFQRAWEDDRPAEAGARFAVPELGIVQDLYAIVRISDALSYGNWRWKMETAWLDTKKPGFPESLETTLSYLRKELATAGLDEKRIVDWCGTTDKNDGVIRERWDTDPLKEIIGILQDDKS